MEELLARADADPSGALSLDLVKDVVDIGGKVISGIDGIKNLFSYVSLTSTLHIVDLETNDEVLLYSGNQQRDFEELLARELTTDESGAIDFKSIINIGSSIIQGLGSFLGGNDNNNKRELMDDLVAREVHDLLVREDESGALNIGGLVKTGLSIFSSLFGGDNNNKRDAGAAPTAPAPATPASLAQYTDASGAFDFGKFAKDALNVAGTIAPFLLKRDELETLLARDSAPVSTPTTATPPASLAQYTDASGAFDFGKFAKDALNVAGSIAPFFFKRAELDALLARDAPAPAPVPASLAQYTDASGAFDFGKFAKDALNVAGTIAPFLLKREEMDLLAREIPQFNGHPLFRIGTVLPPKPVSLNALD